MSDLHSFFKVINAMRISENRVFRKGSLVKSEERLEAERGKPFKIWRKSVPGRKSGVCLECCRNCKWGR